MDTLMVRNHLKQKLQKDILEITFTKKDGAKRKMLCTLMPEKIPEENKEKNKIRKHSEEVLPVFDIEKQAWRSFRIDSVISWNQHIRV